MDENQTKNSSIPIPDDEMNVNLNDLFTIDFNNLKVFLTTVIKNQNDMAKKIKELEKKLREQDNKTIKNYFLIDKRIKSLENNIQNNENKDKDKKEEETVKNKDSDKDRANKEEKMPNKDDNYKFHRKGQRTKTFKEKEIDHEIKNDTIPEEDSIKSNEKLSMSFSAEDEDSHNENKDKNKDNKPKSQRKYEDPYRDVPIRHFGDNNRPTNMKERLSKYTLNISEVEEIKKRLELLEKKSKSSERGSKFLSLKSLESSNISNEDIKFLKLGMKDLMNKNEELTKDNEDIKKDLEEVKVKVKDFDIYEIFKDCRIDEETLDAARALVLVLEQKIFKKTELIDEKIRKIDNGMNTLEVEQKTIKNITEILKLSNEDVRRMIKNLGELENKNAEEALNLSNEINDVRNNFKKMNDNLDKKIDEYVKNNNDILDKIQENILQVEQRLTENENNIVKLEQIPKVDNKDKVDSKYFLKIKNELEETIHDLKKKDNDLEKQIEFLKSNPEINKTKEDIIKLQKELNLKTNLKEFMDLKDKLNIQYATITNLRDNIDKIQELSNKSKNDMGFLIKRIEALSAAQVSTRTALDELLGKEQEFMIDTSKFLEITAFNKFVEGVKKDREKNEQSINSIHKLLNDMAEVIKTKASAEDMKTFEEIINNKLEELKLFCLKKFPDKIENSKNIKYLDSQIRHIIDVYIKKLDKQDSWLIAKKPLGGYSCASCEAYLGELKKSQDYMPWNKYPNRERDKNFRLGNGFSKMLNMLNVDFRNQIEQIRDNTYESDNEKDGRNSAEKNINKRRLSKNLSSANIHSTNINTGKAGNKNILPKINTNKGEEFNGNLSVDVNAKNSGETNEYGSLINNSDDTKYNINAEKNEDQPHVVKVYRKNKLNTSDSHKKI